MCKYTERYQKILRLEFLFSRKACGFSLRLHFTLTGFGFLFDESFFLQTLELLEKIELLCMCVMCSKKMKS